MDLAHLPQLVLERFQQAVRQHRVPVLVALAGTHGHQPLLAIEVFHSQPESLHKPSTTAVEQPRHQPLHAIDAKWHQDLVEVFCAGVGECL